LILSAGEARSGGADKDYLLANVVESFIGAVYQTQGLEAVQKFISEWILVDVEEILRTGAHRDAKSEFQELTQGTLGVTPHYDVLSEEGKDHEKEFKIGAYIDEHLVGMGTGGSKKEAQTSAAAHALEKKVEWLSLLK
jgi:ribonuclease III